MKGYQILYKGKPVKHQLQTNTGAFAYVIFETLEEAQKYAMYDHEIKKVDIKQNKTNLKW